MNFAKLGVGDTEIFGKIGYILLFFGFGGYRVTFGNYTLHTAHLLAIACALGSEAAYAAFD